MTDTRASTAREEARRLYPFTVAEWSGTYDPPPESDSDHQRAFIAGAEWERTQADERLKTLVDDWERREYCPDCGIYQVWGKDDHREHYQSCNIPALTRPPQSSGGSE